MKLLFIGNSATYVHDLPATLAALCETRGITVSQTQLVDGGRFLKDHAKDPAVFEEIAKGYDAVFLQENGNAMMTEEERQQSLSGCKAMIDAAVAAGSRCLFYVRPPYGKRLDGHDSMDQCILFDRHFTPAAEAWGVTCAYVNRAFAYVIKHHAIPLWGEDNAHTSEQGAYLAVCTLYASLFGDSAAAPDTAYGLSEDEAAILRGIADRIVRDGVIPWED